MVITPLGAGSEVGRSCVHMTFKGRTVLVSNSNPFPASRFVAAADFCSCWDAVSSTAASTRPTPAWRRCPTSTRSIRPP
jgi:hypothetical protein